MDSAWEGVVCHPTVQLWGASLLCFMGLYVAGWLKVILRVRAVTAELVSWRRDQRDNAQAIAKAEAQKDQPKITVLLPVKGVHENTFNNWHVPASPPPLHPPSSTPFSPVAPSAPDHPTSFSPSTLKLQQPHFHALSLAASRLEKLPLTSRVKAGTRRSRVRMEATWSSSSPWRATRRAPRPPLLLARFLLRTRPDCASWFQSDRTRPILRC